jgi:asparagine synthetase B (glutamine-hydrolysing)
LTDAGQRCRSYTAGYEGDASLYDFGWADAASSKLQVPHRSITVRPEMLDPETLSRLFKQFDEPFDASRAVTEHALCEAAREDGISSCLNGIGGENLFGGIAWRQYEKEAALRPGTALDDYLLDMKFFDFDEQATLLVEPADGEEVTRTILNPFYERAEIEDPYERASAILLLRTSTGRHGLFSHFVPPLSGVEVTPAYRDQELVSFCRTIPFALKEGASRESDRVLLQGAFADVLPPFGVKREKRPYPGIPWTLPAFAELEHNVVSAVQGLKDLDLFWPKRIDRLIEKYRRKPRRRHADKLWLLFCFRVWHAFYVEGSDPFAH